MNKKDMIVNLNNFLKNESVNNFGPFFRLITTSEIKMGFGCKLMDGD